MKLWLLRPAEGKALTKYPHPNPADDPWSPWYDKNFGFVIRAETEDDARRIADEKGGDENTSTRRPWLDAAYSTCVELAPDGEPGVVISDYASA